MILEAPPGGAAQHDGGLGGPRPAALDDAEDRQSYQSYTSKGI